MSKKVQYIDVTNVDNYYTEKERVEIRKTVIKSLKKEFKETNQNPINIVCYGWEVCSINGQTFINYGYEIDPTGVNYE